MARRTTRLMVLIGICSLWVFSVSTYAGKMGDDFKIIPQPVSVDVSEGYTELKQGVTISVKDKSLKKAAAYLADYFPVASQLAEPSNADATICLMLQDDDRLGQEGYRLTVTKGEIVISGNTPAGVFYGIQTLRQLLPADSFGLGPKNLSSVRLPCAEIIDYPRFSWRGGHLDVGRHFMSKEFVKKYIDLLAIHKFNRMHWHLTEDQGWRIEIKKYPRLTEIGSIRKETLIPHTDQYDGKPHGGFYTQQDIKEIVAYARDRYVTIVPEIEFPGHSLAAIVAYPELGCTGKQLEVWGRWGVSRDICNPSEKTMAFFKDVFKEVALLFPGEYFHIGGDEAPLDQWKDHPVAQQRMKELGLKNTHELQSYLLNELNRYLATLGKRSVGWCDILSDDLNRETVIMPYHGNGYDSCVRAVRSGHQVVMTPTFPTYFDYIPADDGHPAIGRANPIENVYAFEPVLPGIPDDGVHLIIGSQFHCWTEYMPTPEIVEKRVYPRACAMAEVLWTAKQKKNLEDFKKRMHTHSRRLLAYGVNHRPFSVPQARWKTSDITEHFSLLEVDGYDTIASDGVYEVEFVYRSGRCGIDISEVTLYDGQKLLARDAHPGFAGAQNRRNVYMLKVPAFSGKPILRMKIKGNGGTDSNGEILIRRAR